jgi:uncharacterized protein
LAGGKPSEAGEDLLPLSGTNFLGVFAKYPETGKVKTRLARDIGPDNAAAACKRLAEHVLKMTAPTDASYRRIVFYTPETMRVQFENWLPGEIVSGQRGRDVGERMQNALQEMFARGAGKAIVVGSDIPGLHREIVTRAFRQLDDADVVIGPAVDGGYYLIGMRSLQPEIFRNIAWGTGEVFSETVAVIETLGLRYHLSETLFDVDILEDYIRAEEIMRKAEY